MAGNLRVKVSYPCSVLLVVGMLTSPLRAQDINASHQAPQPLNLAEGLSNAEDSVSAAFDCNKTAFLCWAIRQAMEEEEANIPHRISRSVVDHNAFLSMLHLLNSGFLKERLYKRDGLAEEEGEPENENLPDIHRYYREAVRLYKKDGRENLPRLYKKAERSALPRLYKKESASMPRLYKKAGQNQMLPRLYKKDSGLAMPRLYKKAGQSQMSPRLYKRDMAAAMPRLYKRAGQNQMLPRLYKKDIGAAMLRSYKKPGQSQLYMRLLKRNQMSPRLYRRDGAAAMPRLYKKASQSQMSPRLYKKDSGAAMPRLYKKSGQNQMLPRLYKKDGSYALPRLYKKAVGLNQMAMDIQDQLVEEKEQGDDLDLPKIHIMDVGEEDGQ